VIGQSAKVRRCRHLHGELPFQRVRKHVGRFIGDNANSQIRGQKVESGVGREEFEASRNVPGIVAPQQIECHILPTPACEVGQPGTNAAPIHNASNLPSGAPATHNHLVLQSRRGCYVFCKKIYAASSILTRKTLPSGKANG